MKFLSVTIISYSWLVNEYELLGHLTPYKTRSQAVARIADRTASQHLRGSRDVIGHVTI